MTPAGIEPATFRFVAQHLNHCATIYIYIYIYIYIQLIPKDGPQLSQHVVVSIIKWDTRQLCFDILRPLPYQ